MKNWTVSVDFLNGIGIKMQKSSTAVMLTCGRSDFFVIQCVPMIKGFIFDLDGTVLDTVADINFNLNRTLGTFFTDEQCKMFVGNGLKNCMKNAMESVGMNLENLQENYEKLIANYSECPVKYTRPYEGVVDFLEYLKNRNIAVGIFSNKKHDLAVRVVEECLEMIDFDFICGRDYLYAPKPDPQAVFAFCEQIHATKDEIVYVGDSEVDNLCAVNANVKHYILTWGSRSRDYLVSHGVCENCLVDSMDEIRIREF